MKLWNDLLACLDRPGEGPRENAARMHGGGVRCGTRAYSQRSVQRVCVLCRFEPDRIQRAPASMAACLRQCILQEDSRAVHCKRSLGPKHDFETILLNRKRSGICIQ